MIKGRSKVHELNVPNVCGKQVNSFFFYVQKKQDGGKNVPNAHPVCALNQKQVAG